MSSDYVCNECDGLLKEVECRSWCTPPNETVLGFVCTNKNCERYDEVIDSGEFEE